MSNTSIHVRSLFSSFKFKDENIQIAKNQNQTLGGVNMETSQPNLTSLSLLICMLVTHLQFMADILIYCLDHFSVVIALFKRCGVKKLIYVVEGDPNSSEAAESIKTA